MAAIRVNRPDLTVPHVCLRVHFIEHGLPIRMGWFEGGIETAALKTSSHGFPTCFHSHLVMQTNCV